MFRRLQWNPDRLFYITLGIIAVAGLFNLQYLPVIWTDEVMNLDPALQWHKHGHYAGFLWPNPGSDKVFLSYPPLIQWFHIGTMYLLPFDVFWMRLPFLIMHCGSLWLFYRILRGVQGLPAGLALTLSFMFAFDKVVFEISRSMRVEVLEVFLLMLLLYLWQARKAAWLRALVCGLLLTAHLSMWPLVGLYLLYETAHQQNVLQRLMFPLLAAVPWLLFLAAVVYPAGADLHELWAQLFSQAEKHASHGGILQRITAHFWERFWPVYKEQPWVPAVWVVLFLSAVRQMVQSRGKDAPAAMYLGTFLCWMLVLAPHYRYLPPLYALGLLVLSREPILRSLFAKPRFQRLLVAGIPFLATGFIARHAIAGMQHAERDPAAVESWIARHTTGGKTLMLGNAAGFYLTESAGLDYGMDMYPQNLHPENYDRVLLITGASHKLPLISEFGMSQKPLPPFLKKFGKAQTYAGLKIYRIRNTEEWEMVTGKYAGDYAR